LPNTRNSKSEKPNEEKIEHPQRNNKFDRKKERKPRGIKTTTYHSLVYQKIT
jgi:hypothetical protein